MDSNITMLQILLLSLYGVLAVWDKNNMALGFNGAVAAGFFAGLIMGDLKTGLIIGGTMNLMGLGVSSYGGASVPDYMTATIISTAFSTMNHLDAKSALALAIPISLLCVNFDVLARFANVWIQHQAEKAADRYEFSKIERLNLLGMVPWGLSRFLPIFISLWLGSDFISSLLKAMPDWLIGGLKVAGGVLPVLGIAILLRYLPVKRNVAFLIIGFVLAAYLKIPIIGISLIALAITLIVSRTNIVSKKDVPEQQMSSATDELIGVDEDE